MEITYIPAEIPLNNPLMKTAEGAILWRKRTIDISTLIEKLTDYIRRRSVVPFNFYELLQLSTYSYLSIPDQMSLNGRIISQAFEEPDISTLLGNPTFGRGTQIYFNYNTEKPNFPDHATNKIHLMVKHEYILDCILRLAGPKGFHTLFPRNKVIWKVYIWNKDSNLNPDDTVLREVNGGVAATFVLYGSSEFSVMDTMIQHLLKIFPDHATYGLMKTTGTHTIAAGHVRINSMMSYASSDRAELLDARNANLKAFSKEKVRRLPAWVKELGCDNALSQLYIGKDVCNSSGPVDFETLCNTEPTDDEKKDPDSRNFCYMNPDTIDPRRFSALRGGRRRTRRSSRSKRRGLSRKKNARKQNRKNTGRTHH